LSQPFSDDAELYSVDNLPFGVFSRQGSGRSVGVRFGEAVLDVAALAPDLRLGEAEAKALAAPSLNPFLALGLRSWTRIRDALQEWLSSPPGRSSSHLRPLSEIRLHLPFKVADYVDFYSSEYHAANVGRIFRPDAEPLTPNWKWLPIGYHGRAGTVVVSGTPVRRPCGQRRVGSAPPEFGPSVRLDIEAEVGFVVGPPSRLGSPVGLDDFEEHVFGLVLLNDWSARDIQAFEYVPLGPFLGKSFATSISPWVVPLAALELGRVPPPARDPVPVGYLDDSSSPPWGLDLALEVSWNGTVVSRPPFRTMYWTPAQQLAHMTVNGASLRTGDLYASGTVSGPEAGERGSFLELSWNGTTPVRLDDGSERTFLEDGDEVTIRGTAPGAGGGRIGLGEVSGRVDAALPPTAGVGRVDGGGKG
jgi:fumarylacetoacetase